jgi:hypothetical protein
MQEALIFAVSAMVIALAWVGLVYGLLGYFEPSGQRWVSTITTAIFLPASILITRRLTINEIRAHERGINLGVGAVSKAAHDTADIRTRMTTIVKQAQPGSITNTPAQWDQLLPRPGTGAVIVSRSSHDTTPLDL